MKTGYYIEKALKGLATAGLVVALAGTAEVLAAAPAERSSPRMGVGRSAPRAPTARAVPRVSTARAIQRPPAEATRAPEPAPHAPAGRNTPYIGRATPRTSVGRDTPYNGRAVQRGPAGRPMLHNERAVPRELQMGIRINDSRYAANFVYHNGILSLFYWGIMFDGYALNGFFYCNGWGPGFPGAVIARGPVYNPLGQPLYDMWGRPINRGPADEEINEVENENQRLREELAKSNGVIEEYNRAMNEQPKPTLPQTVQPQTTTQTSAGAPTANIPRNYKVEYSTICEAGQVDNVATGYLNHVSWLQRQLFPEKSYFIARDSQTKQKIVLTDDKDRQIGVIDYSGFMKNDMSAAQLIEYLNDGLVKNGFDPTPLGMEISYVVHACK